MFECELLELFFVNGHNLILHVGNASDRRRTVLLLNKPQDIVYCLVPGKWPVETLQIPVFIPHTFSSSKHMHTQDVQGVAATALSSKVVIKFISSFWGRGNFCQSRHFVRVCE